jgi:hypothetical protein
MIERMYTKMRTGMNMRSGKVLGWVFFTVTCTAARCVGMRHDSSGTAAR